MYILHVVTLYEDKYAAFYLYKMLYMSIYNIQITFNIQLKSAFHIKKYTVEIQTCKTQIENSRLFI